MEPKIRFKGFEGEWKTEDFQNSFDPLRNNSLSRAELADDGKIANIHYGDVLIKYSECIDTSVDKLTYILDNEIGKNLVKNGALKRGDIIFADAAEDNTVGKCSELLCKDNELIVSGLHTIACRPRLNVAEKYLGYYLNSPAYHNQLLPHIQGTKISSISKKAINTTFVVFPTQKAEQQEIASYFTSLDSQISAATSRLASLKQMKAASLQAMFPQEGETVPKIRFKGFEGEWKKVKLNSFAKRVTRKNSHLESTLALTIASAHGLVSQIDYFNNLVVGSNIRNYYLLKKGEFAYNKSYSNGYPFGSVKRLERYEQGILSTLYITFSIDNSISSDYLTHFFDTNLWHKEVAERAAEGARNHGLLNIGANDFLDINIWKPESKDEQQAIASYFTSLDRQISLQSQRLEKLKQIKSACLDKMFV